MRTFIKQLFVGISLAALTTSAFADDAKFVGWAYSEVAGKNFIEEQVKKIDGTDIELIGFPWNQMVQNLILRHRSSQATEVVQIQERWMPMLIQLGALVDLNEVYGAEKLAEIVDPGLLKMGQFDGKQYGIPWTGASIAMVANQKVMDKAGITKVPATMEEFYEALKLIKENVPNSVPFGLSTTNPNLIQVESQIIFWQHGARFFTDGKVSIDTAEARQALDFMVKLVNEGLVAKGNDRNATRKLFSQELVGFYFDPPVARGFARKLTGQGADYDANVFAIPTPSTGNDEPPRSVIWAHLMGMMTAGEVNKEGGAKVIEHFALNADTQKDYWFDLGMFPTTKAALSEIGKDPYVADWVNIASTALLDEPASFENSAAIRKIIGEEVEAALLGTKTTDEAITTMATRLNGAL